MTGLDEFILLVTLGSPKEVAEATLSAHLLLRSEEPPAGR